VGYERRFYPESQFGGFTDIDGTIAFYTRVHALLTPASVVLDYGCGRGCCVENPVPIRRDLRILKGKCAKVIGVDVDRAGSSNPYLDEFHLMSSTNIPLDDATVDLCVCDSVLEHVVDVDHYFGELSRVIRPGGYLCIRTANRLGYVGLLATLIPNRFHHAAIKKSGGTRQEEDVFPTVYRCNTQWRIRRMLRKSDFSQQVVYVYEAEPCYLSFSKCAYFLGVLHQKLALKAFRLALFAFAKRD